MSVVGLEVFDPPRRIFRAGARLQHRRVQGQGSALLLGFLWSLLNPLLLSAILFLVFRRSLSSGRSDRDYFLDIFAGAVVWNFFVMATTVGSGSLLVRAELIKNIAFSIEVPVYGDIGALVFQYLLELLALFATALALGARPSFTVLLLPLLLLGQIAFVTGIALVLACLSLIARDLQHIWSLLTRVLFFATPVFYPLSLVPRRVLPLVEWNPVAETMASLRTLCHGGMPGPIELLVSPLDRPGYFCPRPHRSSAAPRRSLFIEKAWTLAAPIIDLEHVSKEFPLRTHRATLFGALRGTLRA